MTPRETAAARAAFEADAKRYGSDLLHDVRKPGSYVCLFTEGRWMSWQAAWRAGQQYAKGAGGRNTAAPEEVAPPIIPVASSTPHRVMRPARA